MGKYSNSTSDILKVFATTDWVNEGIKTYPRDFVSSGLGTEFVRVSVIHPNTGINRQSVSGLFIAEIFTENGKGPKRAAEIADVLDKYLANKVFNNMSGTTQMLGSTLKSNGQDPANTALVKSTFSVPFIYTEVL
jgi:hypothetical protein